MRRKLILNWLKADPRSRVIIDYFESFFFSSCVVFMKNNLIFSATLGTRDIKIVKVKKFRLVGCLAKLRLAITVIPFLGKFGQNNQNCWFKLKFGTKINSNMQNSTVVFSFSVLDRNSMVVFSFSVLDRQYPFRANLVAKSLFKQKFVI